MGRRTNERRRDLEKSEQMHKLLLPPSIPNVVSATSGDVEKWHDEIMELFLVPPLSWQASIYIHRRILAVYGVKREVGPLTLGGGGVGSLPSPTLASRA